MPMSGAGTPNTFNGFTHITACTGGIGASDCDSRVGGATSNCERLQTWMVTGGTAGTVYNVNVTFTGLAECKVYNNCTRRNTSSNLGTAVATNAPLDLACTGGTVPNSTYNVFEFRVQNNPAISTTPEYTRLNAGPSGCEIHYTYPIRSMVTFQVRQGSTVSFRQFDSNCRAISNCGPSANTYNQRAMCDGAARSISGVTLPAQFYGAGYPAPSRGPNQPFDAQFVQIMMMGDPTPM
jgi:hypothetical protein